MLSEGQQYVATAWWLATFPGLALFGLVLAVNILGDAVRDRLDPTRRVGRRAGGRAGGITTRLIGKPAFMPVEPVPVEEQHA
jgi:peptide/nickel transport system permease protein